MTLPEGWQWLDELPEEWVPPVEMQEPTNTVTLNLPIRILSSQIVGNDLLELVGVWIAENARFSMWFATEAKAKAPSDKELAFLSLVSHEQARHVYEAWKRYVEAFAAGGGMAGDYDDEKLTLRDALLNAISTLTEARGRFDGRSSSAQ